MGAIEARLEALGLSLPPPPRPVGNYVGAVQAGRLLFVGGVVGWLPDGRLEPVGKVGREVSREQAYASARACALNHLAIARSVLGDLDRVERVVKVVGFVNGAPGFCDQPAVIDGESDLLVRVWGEAGRHARLALGVADLWGDAPVETEITLLLRE